MVVVAGRVLAPRLDEAVVLDDGADGVEPLLVSGVGLLFLVGQTVQADILLAAAARRGGKGVGLRGLLGNLAPLGVAESLGTVDGHATLVELLAVAQHVLRDLAEVDVEVAGVLRCGACLALVDEGVEEPKLHVFDVGLLKVGGLQLAHHAAPLRGGTLQRAVGIELRRQVVGTALLGIVGQIQHGQRRHGTVVG